jgi:hypothetical protein
LKSGASTSWNPQGLSRPLMGLLYLYTLINYFCRSDLSKNLIVSRLVQNIPAFHRTMNILCGVHKSLPFISVLAQVNPSHALQSHFLKIHFNITSHLLRVGFLTSYFLTRILYAFVLSPYVPLAPLVLLLSPECYLLQSKIALLLVIEFQPS